MFDSRLTRAAVLGTALLWAGASAHALPLFDFESASDSPFFVPVGTTLGYSFHVSSDISIVGIGMFDFGADGLDSAHEVALWSSDGTTRLAEGILNPASSGAPGFTTEASQSTLGDYIFKDIALVLGQGTYVLGVSYLPANGNKDVAIVFPNDPLVENSNDATFGMGRFPFPVTENGVIAEFPNLNAPRERYFGPALRIATATIPEPLTLALLVTGLAAVGLGRRHDETRRQAPGAALPA